MEARMLTLYDFLDNSSSQFYIPVFQREYIWSTSQIKQLLIDLENILEQKFETHFFGNVIYKNYAKDNFNLKQLIDGQQRITTFFLILNCIKNILIEKNKLEKYIVQIKDLFLENRFIDGKYKLKLKPEIDNTEVYDLISQNRIKELKENKKKYSKNNLFINYLEIEKYILNWLEKYEIEKIIGIFLKVKIVQIIIDETDKVDAHKIFESINSTGVSLTNFDLIRNYILMKYNDLDQQKIFSENWKPFELRIFNINKKFPDKLIRILIQFFKKDYVLDKEIYSNFKEIFSNIDEIEVLQKLNYALDLYENFYTANKTEISKIEYVTFMKLEPNKNELYSTVFMILLDKFNNNLIEEKEYNESVKILSEYIFRRKVADLDTSPITRFFNETLLKKIKDVNTGIKKVLHMELFENNKNNQMYAPSNSEINLKLETINFYDLSICKIFFWYLENWNNPIHLNYSSLTIEHIAPKSWKKGNWVKELMVQNEEEYQTKINLLGNLTILPEKANILLSNDDWLNKKTKLSEFKHIKINEQLLEFENFNYKSIKKRQGKLVEEFFKIFAL